MLSITLYKSSCTYIRFLKQAVQQRQHMDMVGCHFFLWADQHVCLWYSANSLWVQPDWCVGALHPVAPPPPSPRATGLFQTWSRKYLDLWRVKSMGTLGYCVIRSVACVYRSPALLCCDVWEFTMEWTCNLYGEDIIWRFTVLNSVIRVVIVGVVFTVERPFLLCKR